MVVENSDLLSLSLEVVVSHAQTTLRRKRRRRGGEIKRRECKEDS